MAAAHEAARFMSVPAPLVQPTNGLGPEPFYLTVGDEADVFLAAAAAGLPVLLKGPTGCGKTRFVQAMAARLHRDLVTVACHEDLSAADLTGRYLLRGGETVWLDGPLTRAVRSGAICYLDEVVEARADSVVVIHPLTDHRRELSLERTGETLRAAPGFQLVVSYNPGYQSLLKDLKDSTRQRMVALELDYPRPDAEQQIVQHEGGVGEQEAAALVRLAVAVRTSADADLREVASTRTLVTAARLHAAGLPLRRAALAAVAVPLSDDAGTTTALAELVEVYVV